MRAYGLADEEIVGLEEVEDAKQDVRREDADYRSARLRIIDSILDGSETLRAVCGHGC